MYAGQAVGAASGGWLISRDLMGALNWVGLAILVVAMGVSVAASRRRHAA
jgi:MFS transporter, DHA1 family, inner membrane transport protein